MFPINPETFQFHKGTIKTCLLLPSVLYLFNFNSIKVRLKLFGSGGAPSSDSFQFHKGTIKTP